MSPLTWDFMIYACAETQEDQADLAREYGVEAFCYYHYWFGNGRRILERPFNEVVASGKPDFPFCLCWANETWTGIWHGAGNRILIEQTYPGEADHRAHFETLLPAFADRRHITIDGKPVFCIYKPEKLAGSPSGRSTCGGPWPRPRVLPDCTFWVCRRT